MRRPSQIILVITSMAQGGAERVLSILANHWAERGLKIHLITFEGDSNQSFYSLSEKINYIKLGTLFPKIVANAETGRLSFIFKIFYSAFALRSVIRKISSGSGPTILLSFLTHANLSVILASMGLEIPTLVSERSYPLYSAGLMGRLARRFLYPFSTGIIVLTRTAAEFFPNAWRTKITVIPNPVLKTDMISQRTSTSVPMILGVGRLSPEKRFDLLIQSFSRVHLDFPMWRLLILGDGPQRETLQRLAIDLGLGGKVDFRSAERNVGPFYANAEIFVLSSDFEGFPNALGEAMAAGLACIATDCICGPSEMIDSSRNGLLVTPQNLPDLEMALRLLLSNEPLRRLLAKEASRITEKFSMTKISRMWDETFLKALQKNYERS